MEGCQEEAVTTRRCGRRLGYYGLWTVGRQQLRGRTFPVLFSGCPRGGRVWESERESAGGAQSVQSGKVWDLVDTE